VYETEFALKELPQKNLYIDLGNVMVMAKVTLNGQYVGGVWTFPYRLNVTGYLKEGENKLEITVVNNWQNRLIGDQRLPEDQRHQGKGGIHPQGQGRRELPRRNS
jgi:hypothetical protein